MGFKYDCNIRSTPMRNANPKKKKINLVPTPYIRYCCGKPRDCLTDRYRWQPIENMHMAVKRDTMPTPASNHGIRNELDLMNFPSLTVAQAMLATLSVVRVQAKMLRS